MYLEYIKYVVRHKWYVMVECFKQGLIWRGLMHDLSKFRPSELIWYARSFYGDRDQVKDQFDMAWLLHQHRNPHHWQYWMLVSDEEGGKLLPMSDSYWKEMVCDWVGAGKAQGYLSPAHDPYKETRSWYGKNRANILLHSNTREKVESMIGYSGDADVSVHVPDVSGEENAV